MTMTTFLLIYLIGLCIGVLFKTWDLWYVRHNHIALPKQPLVAVLLDCILWPLWLLVMLLKIRV